MTKFSIILGVLGLFATAAGVPYLSRWGSNWGPRQYWLLGLMALFPAWLIAFLGLLPSSGGPEYDPLPRSALLSSVVALLGVVFTDTAVRRLDKSGYSLWPFTYWLLGATGLVPAWVVALWILLWKGVLPIESTSDAVRLGVSFFMASIVIYGGVMTAHKKALLSEYFTVGWNVIEGVIAIAAGVYAGSIALVGFGLDSYIEVASGLVLIWRLRKHGFSDEEEEETAEKRAVLFVGVTFFLLAGYVVYESAKKIVYQEPAEESLIGIVLAFVSLMVMPLLAFYKKKIAAEINSRALRADALETLACSYLSLTLLLGLGANALFAWWWADPVAALAMVYFLIKEGREAVEKGWEVLVKTNKTKESLCPSVERFWAAKTSKRIRCQFAFARTAGGPSLSYRQLCAINLLATWSATWRANALQISLSRNQQSLGTRFLIPALVNFLSRVASNRENGRNGQTDKIMDRLSKILGASLMASFLPFVANPGFCRGWGNQGRFNGAATRYQRL